MNTIRILDLNIWNYNEPWATRRGLIRDLIRVTEPDLVALQEVRYRDWSHDPRHQADQILDGLPGYAAVWHPAHYWPPRAEEGEGRQWEGLAILSSHPIVDCAIAHLSRASDDPRDTFQRLVLGAQVRTPAGSFWLFNTHYPLSGRARNRVVFESLAFVRHRAGNMPFAFTGDLNAEPDDLPIRYLTGQTEIRGQRGTLVDAWTACHPDEAGYTYPAWEPQKRIDYLFVPSTARIQKIAVVGTTPSRETISPSDHCGLLVTLSIGDDGP
jgi:endonuclease/exonuclease/phosphatase family metal-dependent hydrolase